MVGFTHIGIGLGLTNLLMGHGGVPGWLGTGMLILGSLAPDIDNPRSMISHPGTLLRTILPRPITALINLSGRVSSGVVGVFSSHRGMTHWPIIPLIGLTLFLKVYDNQMAVWFFWGYLLHIAADAFTMGGVPPTCAC